MTHILRSLGILGSMSILLWGIAMLSFVGDQDMVRMLLCCVGLFGSALMGHGGLVLADRLERAREVQR